MRNQNKSRSAFSKVLTKLSGNTQKTPLQKEYYKNLETMLSNSLFRLIVLALDVVLLFLLLYFARTVFGYTTNITEQFIITIFFLALFYFPAIYLYRSGFQLLIEMAVNTSIYDARHEIAELRKPESIRNYRLLQARINRVRQSLKDFVEYSEILSPPIFNYELDRLQKKIDTFFNCSSEVLVPINKLFSRSEEFVKEIEQAQYESTDISPDEEFLEMQEEEIRQMTGEITDFNLRALDEFMQYLWNALFDKEAKRYSPITFKHPVNLIVISRFFDAWNSIISSCSNCKTIFEKASKDIDEYYKLVGKMQSQRRQRILGLQDAAVIVIISVILSTIIQHFI
jgi:hypothetical protein